MQLAVAIAEAKVASTIIWRARGQSRTKKTDPLSHLELDLGFCKLSSCTVARAGLLILGWHGRWARGTAYKLRAGWRVNWPRHDL